jgi:hypothetical protein
MTQERTSKGVYWHIGSGGESKGRLRYGVKLEDERDGYGLGGPALKSIDVRSGLMSRGRAVGDHDVGH